MKEKRTMNYRCGHELEESTARNLGRGRAREQRIANYAKINCASCKRQLTIDRAHKLTHADGSPLSEQEVINYLAKHGIKE